MLRTMKRMAGVGVFLTWVCAVALSMTHSGTAATRAAGPDFRDRVRAQEAIERVVYAHRIWPKENPGPKPLFDESISTADLEAKVNGALLKSAALEKYWQVPITAEQLQAEMDRMARGTKDAATLQELFAAMGNDPALIAECLARPVLADRLIHEKFASDEKFHGEIRHEAETLWGKLTPDNFQALGGNRYHPVQIEREDGQQADVLPVGDQGAMRLSKEAFSRTAADFPEEGKISDVVEQDDAFVIFLTGYRDENLLTGGVIVFPKRSFDAWWEEVALTLAPRPTLPAAPAYTLPSLKTGRAEVAAAPGPAPNLPVRMNSTELSTGAETLIWGGGAGVSYTMNTGLRYDPATDTRMALPAGFPCPSARWGHTAVWTGTEMIVWGGNSMTPTCSPTNTGGRYNPLTGAWSVTSTKAPCPPPIALHTAAWTGKVMAVQGEPASGVPSASTGGRYNPATDTWAAGSAEDSGPHPLVTATVGATGATYTTLQAAFTDINNGAGGLTGAIILNVVDNTTETAPAVLNASGTGSASYTSVLVQPSGGAPRTISGAIAAGSPLVDLNGADNATFDGLNTGGNSLTISNTTASATSGTSTIRFINGATSNTVTNATVLGSFSAAVATNGGNIYFATDGSTAGGNDNNTISFCNIGPAGANLPTKGIYGNGTATNAALGNNGVVIDNNNIYDYFGAAVASAGVYIGGGCSGWTITNNKFYQTATRTWTTGANNRAIDIANTATTTGAQGFTITGNTIGYASNSGAGTYTLTGSTGKFAGIAFNGLTAGTASSISNNTIAAVSLTGVTSSGTGTSSPFMAILVTNGVANTNSNTIGSQAATGSLAFSTNTTTATDAYGIFNFSVDNWTANSNAIGGISVTNAAASGTFVLYGMRVNTGTTVAFNAASNLVGGTVANSIQLSATGTASQVIGMHSSNAACNFSLNTIRNLSTNIGTGTTTGASVIGINITTSTPNHTISQNTITGLTNSNAAAASVVTGIQFTGGTANVVQRNFIYGLTAATNSAAAEVNGIRVGGGTTIYRNNMIALGAGIPNAIGAAATNGGTTGVNGINEFLGTDSFFHNSVYIGGAPTAGTGASYAFNGTQTVNTRSFRDNIFVNARSNAGATGKNYAVKINGTAANPTGLTINNNLYFANGAGAVFGFFNSLDVANLASWKTAVGQDAASFESNPQYLDPANSVPDLHISTLVSTVIEGNGVDVLVTDDFDGQVRAVLTPVDIGADAGNFIGIDLSAPAITYAPLGNTSSTGNRALTAAITDTTGVPTAGSLQPRIYYKKGAGGTWFSSQGSLASGSATSGTWNFTIVASDMGGVATADVIYYYVIAQDTAVPNIGSSPAGVVATDVNTVTTPPALPNTYTVVAAFSGSYNVGATELYTSLTNAGGIFEAINAGVLSGNVTINITSDLAAELGTNALNQWAEDGVGGYTMLIRPSGAPRLVTGSNIGALIRLYGADRVTMDGSTTGATATGVGGNAAIRELTIQNTNTGTSAAVMAVMMGTNGAVGNIIRNVNFLGQDPTTTLVGLAFGGNTVGSAGTDNDGNRVENCSIKRAIYGLYEVGQSAANPNTGTVLTMNDLSATGTDRIRRIGIVVFYESGITITDNAVGGIDTNESADAIGIGVGTQSVDNATTTGGGVTGAVVSRNRITGVNSQSTTGFSAAGIAVAGGAGAANTLADNMIAGVTSPATSPDITAGIFVAGVTGSSTRLYHNSVAMTGDRGAVASQAPSFGLAVTGTDPSVELRDNIFYTTQTSSGGGVNAASYAIGLVTTTFANLDSNANVFWSTGANDGGFRTGSLAGGAGTSYATLALWQTAISDDANSLDADPLFVSPTSDLHLQPCPAASPAVGVGTPIPSVTVDIDGQARSATTPDIGADEVAKITVSNPAVTTGTVGVPFSQTFTQSGGIAPVTFTTASSLPTGLTLAADGTLSGTPTSSGTFPITVTVTDTNGCIGTGPVYTLTIAAQADLAITKTDGVTTATPGGSTTYTITASNAGPSNAPGATVSDTLPAVLTGTWTCVGAGGGACTASGVGNLNDTVNLPAGGSVTYTVTATISPAATGTLSNTATVTAPGGVTDPTPGNNSATDSDTLGCSVITVTNPAVVAGTVGVPFSQAFTASGGTAPYSYSTASVLPTGLTLATDGTLSGTPTVTGTFPITVTATDANSCAGTGSTYSLVISCPGYPVPELIYYKFDQAGQAAVTNLASAPVGTNPAPLLGGLAMGGLGQFGAGLIGSGNAASTDYVNTGWATSLGTGSWTLSLWLTDSPGTTTLYYYFGDATANSFRCFTNGVAGANNLILRGGGLTDVQINGVWPGPAVVTFVYDASLNQVRAYRNGVLASTVAQGAVNLTGTGPFKVCGYATNVGLGAGQLMDEFRLYNRALGAAEVAAVAAATLPASSITITNPAVTTGTVGVPFSQTFTQSGGIAPVTFSTASPLPAGLTLAADGTLSGTPTVSGTFPITVTVIDNNGCTGTGSVYNLVISCQTITVTNPAVTTGTAGVPFSQIFTQSGGIAPVTFSTASALPTGLTLAAGGTLSGTPIQTGTFPITVISTDANGCTGTGAVYNLVISCPAITLAPVTLPAGTQGIPYNQTVVASPSGTTYTYSVTSGSLPPGLSLDTNTGALTGTPTTIGPNTFTITATGWGTCAGSQAYSLAVTDATGCMTNAMSQNFDGVAAPALPSQWSMNVIVPGTGVPPIWTTSAGGINPTGTPVPSSPNVLSFNSFDCDPGAVALVHDQSPMDFSTFSSAQVHFQIYQYWDGGVFSTTSEGVMVSASTDGITWTAQSGLITNADPALPAGTGHWVSHTVDLSTLHHQATVYIGLLGLSQFGYNIHVDDISVTGACCPTITVSNPALTMGTAGVPFSQTFTQSGGAVPVTFSTASALPAGLALGAGGTLSGTPTVTGTFPITVTATDTNGCVGTGAAYTLVISCPAITLAPATLPNGLVGTAYNQTITASGGTGPTTFAVTAGALPGGLTLAVGGALTGTPTAAGLFNFTVTATDANGCTGSLAYSVRICPVITVAPATLPAGLVGTAYNQTITAIGGTGPYTFAVTAGALPGGLTLAVGGALTGTPTTAGLFNFTITATDANGCTGSLAYSVRICSVITVAPATLPNGLVGTAYNQTITASGGTAAYAFAVTAGALPGGLTLAAGGALTGTPTAAGLFTFTVTATDANGCTGSMAYSVRICPVITLAPATFPNGLVGTAYSQTLTAAGGTAPYGYAVTSGVLPGGVTLSAAGVLSGTPSTAGPFNFTVTATDANGCTGSMAYSIRICPVITLSPANLPGGIVGSLYSQTITATGGTGPYSFALTAGALPGGLTLAAGGALAGSPLANGTYTFKITATDANGCTGSASYTIIVSAFDLTFYDDASLSQVCVNSTTGAFTWTVLRGVGIGTYTGTGLVSRYNGTLTVTSGMGLPYTFKLTYYERYHKATGSYTNAPLRVRSTLTDTNTLNDPPVCAP